MHRMIQTLRSIAVALLAAAAAIVVLPQGARAQDAADMFVRLNRLEGQVRELSGQVEQLQHQNRQLMQTLQRFQEDVEFRFQEGGGAGRSGATTPRTQPAPAPQRRGDAFDPSAAPAAPGAPRNLGEAPVNTDNSATGGIAIIGDDPAPGAGAPLDINSLAREAMAASAPAARSGPSIAATGSTNPAQDYDTAVALLRQRQYDAAEMSLRQFLQSHPRDRLVPDATFFLGETYYQRKRYNEAAEQYLKLATDYPTAGRAPEGLLKLGQALNAIGAREQACATFGEVTRKYPQAPGAVRQAAERERARC